MKPAKSIPAEYSALVELLGVDPERLERKIAERIAETTSERDKWLTCRQAAAYVKTAQRTFARKKKELKIPVTERFGVQCFYRGDLDALMIAGLIKPAGKPSIEFPSIALQSEQAA